MRNAERIYQELISENASIWYIADDYGSKIIIKAPSSTIRAIINGCKVIFLFGKDSQTDKIFFHTGVKIYDDAVNFLLITGTHRFVQEHESLKAIMQESSTVIELYNELDVCAAVAYVSFNENDRESILKMLGNTKKLYFGDFSTEVVSSLDSFDYSLDKSRDNLKAREIETLLIEGHFSEWKSKKSFFIGLNEVNEIHLDDQNEGETFEKQIWASLESLFACDLYKNPKIKNKNGERELTDILAFYDKGIFLIESKALAVISLINEKSMDKKVANIQKQIQKGIKQLVGAKKKLDKDVDIFDSNGKIIQFNKNIIPHCIVLVSELLPFGDWKEIVYEMMSVMIKERVYLHVLDLSEFMKYIKISSGKKEYLDFYLMERTKAFIENKSVFLVANIKV
ncbi:MAG: nuclease-related domain-containing protein [Bacteroidaceae bacterium]|nr:nuclease-related domain-containing protein [Bacteroidaceae bacterium]